MNKKKIIAINSTDGKNRIELNEEKFDEQEKELKLEIEVYDESWNLIDNRDKLKKNWEERKLHARIDLSIHPAKWDEKINEGDVKYHLNNIKQESEYRRCKNEAIAKYIFDKILSAPTVTEDGRKVSYTDKVNSVDLIVTKSSNDKEGKIDIYIRDGEIGGNPVRKSLKIPFQNVNFYAYFNPNDTVEVDEMIVFSSPPKEEEPFWTGKKITGAVLVGGLIVALIFFYRKRIWSWIKREDKTKKKEQIEIF